jgi:hypothetical protein
MHEAGYEPAPFSDLYEKTEEFLLSKARNPINRAAGAIKSGMNWPANKVLQYRIDAGIAILVKDEKFQLFEQKFAGYIEPGERVTRKYLDTLLILDQLSDALSVIGYVPPEDVKALDVGCGEHWPYAMALYSFLQNYKSEKPRNVKLEGIDLLASEKYAKQFRQENIQFARKDVLELEGEYDFIFTHKMLSSPSHFRRWNLEPRSVEAIMAKCGDLLRQGGIHFISQYEKAGEYSSVVETIPPERRLVELGYVVDVGNDVLNNFLTPFSERSFRSGICICRK